MRDKEKAKGYAYLAEAIYDLLEEFGPIEQRHKHSKAYKIVRAFQTTLTQALQRGESVRVNGFGTFKVVQTKSRKRSINYLVGGKDQPKNFNLAPRVVITINPKKRVVFTPFKHLLNFINQENEIE